MQHVRGKFRAVRGPGGESDRSSGDRHRLAALKVEDAERRLALRIVAGDALVACRRATSRPRACAKRLLERPGPHGLIGSPATDDQAAVRGAPYLLKLRADGRIL